MVFSSHLAPSLEEPIINGICGIIAFGSPMPRPEELTPMLSSMVREGSDGQHTWADGPVVLGHKSLNTGIGSPADQQPTYDGQLQLSITYDGTIYNFRELKEELEAKGYRFTSDSDTELLLKGYAAWGEQILPRLHGMFALCLHDTRRGRTLLARDHLGIKPLYYAQQGGRVYFASTLPALRAGARQLPNDLDPVSLHHYLTFHSVVPAPRTIFRAVKKLPPANYLLWERDGSYEEHRYWEVAFQRSAAEEERPEEEWADEIAATLRTSVRRCLKGNVPVGALLSGGLDSSVIVALMAEEISGQVPTYSIGFEDTTREDGNEFRYSDLIARKFCTRHEKIFVDSTQLLHNLDDCIAAMSEPMVSHDAIGFYLLSREVSQRIRVVQSGQGADEIFAGYHWYPTIMRGGGTALELYRHAFFDRSHQEVLEVLHPAYHTEWDVSTGFVETHFQQAGANEPVDKALRLDTAVMLVDDPIKRVDNMTRAWGVQARLPFLDRDMVELAASIPPRYKVNRDGKGALKLAAERFVPQEVIYRPKGYFPVPALKYLRGEYLTFARDVFASQAARERNLFQDAYLERLFQDPAAHLTPLGGNKLWQLTLLESWLQQKGV